MRVTHSSLGIQWDSDTNEATNRFGEVLFLESDAKEVSKTFSRWACSFFDVLEGTIDKSYAQGRVTEAGWPIFDFDNNLALAFVSVAFRISSPLIRNPLGEAGRIGKIRKIRREHEASVKKQQDGEDHR